MKINVKIGETVYQVEIENLNTRPIIAQIDGEKFDVWPEMEITSTQAKPVAIEASKVPDTGLPSGQPAGEKGVPSPLPGTVIEVMVSPGDQVQAGDPLLVVEAMKMKNLIRAPHAGTIASVHVITGQSVKHRQPLVEFEA